jgi:hypothetical protein
VVIAVLSSGRGVVRAGGCRRPRPS